MNILAVALGILVWFLTDIVLVRRLVSQTSNQENRLRKGFLFSLNIALALIVAIVFASFVYS